MSRFFFNTTKAQRILCALCVFVVSAGAQTNAPAPQSARWFYERAFIYHLREQDGKATTELYKALDKNPDYMEANYFLGLLFEDRQHWEDAVNTFEKVVSSNAEHLPAKLHLAKAQVENSDYFSAISILEQLSGALKLNTEFVERLKSCRTDLQKRPSDTKVLESIRQDVKKRLRALLDEAEDLMMDTPESYQSATLTRGLKDPLIFNEIADLFYEQEQTGQALGVLEEQLTAREGFAPGVLLQMGRIYEKQEKYDKAISALEQAVTQLKALGFSEAAGDFSTEELQQLRARAKAPVRSKKR